jgi:glycosyltransferase involved in cell wall biosynthesis
MERTILTQATVARPTHPELELVEGFAKGRISVIIPAYNEANCIRKTIRHLQEQFEAVSTDFEIIVIDDGSTDDTKEILSTMASNEVRIVSYARNQGKGHAIRTGINRATGQYAFLVDGDSEIEPRDLASYIRALESADFVIGSKRHPLSTVDAPVIRRILSLGYNILERILTGVNASDTQAGFKAAKSAELYRILPLLSVKRYAYDAELLTVASLLKLRIIELPVRIQLSSTFSSRQVMRMVVDLIGIAYRLRVRRWYQGNITRFSNTYRPIIPW